jgi:pyrroline-5-carboxylate reductase
MNKKIAIIGAGNLGTAIAEGLLKSKFSKPSEIIVTRRNVSVNPLKTHGINITDNNNAAVKKSDVIILAVKPFQALGLLKTIQKEITEKKIIISVVTGVTMQEMENTIGKKVSLFRAMPNTAISIRESMTCLCYTHAKEEDIHYVQELFYKLGKAVFIDEKLMERPMPCVTFVPIYREELKLVLMQLQLR